MSHNFYSNLSRKTKEQQWSGTTRRKAKGKAGNSGIVAKNGQIQQVFLEAIFNKPGWVGRQYK